MCKYLENLYCRFLLSDLGYKVFFWADQGSFLCWLLGHDRKFFEDGNCGRCGMGIGYWDENFTHLKKHGLFLSWKFEVIRGKLAALILSIFEKLS